MAIDTGAVDRALGAIGTTFRLTRLYPPSHPAVLEAMRQITAGLPALAALGTVEWKIGATGLVWHGQHLLPRNTQVAELAGLLFARGVRAIQVNPGVTPEHWLGLFGVAVGNVAPDDAVLGRIGVLLGKRASQRLSAARSMNEPAPAPPPVVAAPSPPPAAVSPAAPSPAPPPPPPPAPSPPAQGGVFRGGGLPADVEARRAVAALQAATTAAEQRATIEQLRRITPDVLALRDIGAIAEIVSGLDRSLRKIQDPEIQEAIGDAAGALADEAIVERMVARLGEPRVPPAERAHLVNAVGARGALPAGPVAAAGDVGASTVLVRRLEQEKDEGVLAALLKAIGQLGAKEALEVLARFAEPGGKPRRTPFVRAAAIEGLARLDRMEAKALLELYARDKEPTVKRAAEASLR